MSNSIDPDEKLIESSHLDLCRLQKPIIIICDSKRVQKLVRISKDHKEVVRIAHTESSMPISHTLKDI